MSTDERVSEPAAPPTRFLDLVRELQIDLDQQELRRFARLIDLILERNRQFNLTSITDPGEAWIKHVLDALTLLPVLDAVEALRVADVGSGAGLPGLPLAIAMPATRFTLLEATGKKARFIREAAETLGLGNVVVVAERAEDAAAPGGGHRERYDAVVARAVGRLPVLLELTVPLARVGGLVIAIKGEQAAAEIAEADVALRELRAAVIDTQRTPTGTIVVIEKLRPTPRTYPRRPGEPKRAPLGSG